MAHENVRAFEVVKYLTGVIERAQEYIKVTEEYYIDNPGSEMLKERIKQLKHELAMLILASDMLQICSEHCIENDIQLVDALEELANYQNGFEEENIDEWSDEE